MPGCYEEGSAIGLGGGGGGGVNPRQDGNIDSDLPVSRHIESDVISRQRGKTILNDTGEGGRPRRGVHNTDKVTYVAHDDHVHKDDTTTAGAGGGGCCCCYLNTIAIPTTSGGD